MVSSQMQAIIKGSATKMPDVKNGMKAPSLKTFIARSGNHPIGEVLRIMNSIVINAVKIIVLIVNLFF